MPCIRTSASPSRRCARKWRPLWRPRRVTREFRFRTNTGLDVLERDNFQLLQGKRIGLITNQTGVDRQGRRNVDAIRAAGVAVAALFSPEHGIGGTEDRDGIDDAVDPATGIKILSLYGKTRRPTPEMLRGLDALVFDIQDVGVRFYTYESTLLYAMEEAAKARLPFYVLDRPDPITGLTWKDRCSTRTRFRSPVPCRCRCGTA